MLLADRDPDIRVWPALVLAPLLALTDLTIGYSLVTPACARQSGAGLHALALVSFVLSLAMTLVAWRAWGRIVAGIDTTRGRVTASDGSHAHSRGSFLALTATLIGALSRLVILAMRVPLFALPPCTP